MVIIKGAKNLDGAKALYDGLLSKEVQEALLVKNFRRPTRTDIDVAKLSGLPALNTLKIFDVNQEAASAEYEQVVALWNSLAKGK